MGLSRVATDKSTAVLNSNSNLKTDEMLSLVMVSC